MSLQQEETALVNAGSKIRVRIDAGEYMLRTLEEHDASARWAEWSADPELCHALNLAARKMTLGEIRSYIRGFDQISKLLWGVFDVKTEKHIGFFTIQADYERSRGLVNLLIGEPEYRNRRVLSTVRRPFAIYFFETLGLRTMMSTVLVRNEIIVKSHLKAGWHIELLLERHLVDQAGGPKLDVYLMALSRETWRARNNYPISDP